MTRYKNKERSSSGAFWRLFGVAILLGSVTVAVIMGMEWLREPETMPLHSVRIEGEFRNIETQDLEAAVARYVDDGFFGVDVDVVRTAVEQLAWVYRASVRRVWPDTLRVRVVEQQALARWGNEGLVNRHGEFFKPELETIPQGLPELSGPVELRQQVVSQYLAMRKAVDKVGRKVSRLTLNERRAWFMQWDNGVEWKLGRADPYPRLLRFLRVYPDLLASSSGELNTVDLRYSNGFAVRWDLQVVEEPGKPG